MTEETLKLGERVFVYQGPLLYDAKIIKKYDPKTAKVEELKLVQPSNKKMPKKLMDQTIYLVHYQGWNTKWDEWVGLDRMVAVNNESIILKAQLEEGVTKKTVKEEFNEKEDSNKRSVKTENGKATIKKAKVNSLPELNSSNKYKGFSSEEVKILVPDQIKLILVDDWENISKDQKLVQLPAQCSVNNILKDFSSYVISILDDDEQTLDLYLEIIASIKQYFNKALGTFLLYRYEKMQYIEMLEVLKKRNVELSDLYSGIFLIRLMSIFPNLMTKNELNMSSIRKMKGLLNSFWKWFNENKEKYLVDNYENQSPSVALLHT